MKNSYYGKLCAIFYDEVKQFAPQDEINFYTSFMLPGGRILEAMAGSGRLQIPLMQLGYQVDGVDCSSDMLARCVLRSKIFGLVPSLYQQYLDQLDTPYKYQTVIIAVGSFQLITAREVALKSLIKIREHMLPTGDLLFSVFDPRLAEPWSKRTVRLSGSKVLNLITRREFEFANNLALAYCCYELVVAGQVEQQEQELISVTWYSDLELEQLLDRAGFKLVGISDYFLPNSDNSRIIHAKLK
jgi:ubiquinone/menaquinone biosynthesis C-methylase UbiE